MKMQTWCISGHVQGVGFRRSLQKLARQCAVIGWVRNNQDGTVTVRVCGLDENLKHLYEECYNLPIVISQIEIQEEGDIEIYYDFTIINS